MWTRTACRTFLQERIDQAVVESYPACIDATNPASCNKHTRVVHVKAPKEPVGEQAN
jgi:hypothetical protein